MRQLSFVILVLVLLLVVSFQREMRALAIKNAGMISLLRVLASEHDRPIEAEQATKFLKASLAQDSSLPRVQSVVRWLEDYQGRAATAQRNRVQLQLIESARSVSNLSEDMEQNLMMAAQQGWIEAELTLAKLNQTRNDNTAYQQAIDRLEQWQPENEIQNTFERSSWRLEGYDWHNLSVTRPQMIYLILYWRKDPNEPETEISLTPEDGRYVIRDRLLQVVKAENKILNGAFEWLQLDSISPRPTDFQLMFHEEDLGRRAYQIQMEGQREPNSFLRMTNTFGETILFVYPNGLHAEQTFILVGRVRSSGHGFLGVREQVEGTNQFTFLVRREVLPERTAHARLFEPQGKNIYIYFGVEDNEENGWAEFDELGLFAIEPPRPEWRTHD